MTDQNREVLTLDTSPFPLLDRARAIIQMVEEVAQEEDSFNYGLRDGARARIESALVKMLHDHQSPSMNRSRGVEAIAAERERQMDVEGWTPEHDDEHSAAQMAAAAACYAYRTVQQADPDSDAGDPPPPPLAWPWDASWWKPKDPRRNLVRAGALIAAEIDRIDRAEGDAP